MEFAEFRKSLESGQIRPAYLLNGFNASAVDKALQLLEKALESSASMVAREKFDGEGVVQLLVSAQSYPMWGEHKLLIVEQGETLFGKQARGRLEPLLNYLVEPSSWATVCLISGEQLRASALKKVQERFEIVVPPQLKGSALQAWAQRLVQQAEMEIEPFALQMLLEVCQGDWAAVERELDKVISSYPPGTRIGADQLGALVEPIVEQSVFDLLRKLVDGNTEEALEKYDRMRRYSRQGRGLEIQVWYWLHRQVRELLLAKSAGPKGLDAESARRLGLRPQAAGVLTRQAKRFSKSLLRQMLDTLEQVDRQLKSSYTTQPEVLLERYIVQFGKMTAPTRRS